MEEINCRYHHLGHIFNDGRRYRCIVENESERIAHSTGTHPASGKDASLSAA
jgi:hypothetical protein